MFFPCLILHVISNIVRVVHISLEIKASKDILWKIVYSLFDILRAVLMFVSFRSVFFFLGWGCLFISFSLFSIFSSRFIRFRSAKTYISNISVLFLVLVVQDLKHIRSEVCNPRSADHIRPAKDFCPARQFNTWALIT